jgi:hypothetical protein
MVTTPERFEDRLLHELRRIVADRPEPKAVEQRRAPRKRLALGGAVVAIGAATIGVAIIASSGDVTPSAYAVEPQANGAVTVSIHALSDASGLQRSLRAAGVPAVVDYAAGGGTGCVPPGPGVDDAAGVPATGATSGGGTSSSGTANTGTGSHVAGAESAGTSITTAPTTSSDPVAAADSARATVAKDAQGDGVTFTIDPGKIKQGETVYITTASGVVGSIGMAISTTEPSTACAIDGS